MNLRQIAESIGTEADAYAYLESLRWPSGEATCPHCGHEGAWYIAPKNGVSRPTRTGNLSERRVWRCGACRKQFSVLTGTVMHGTKISIRSWVMVIFEMCASKNGVAAREIERKYGVCPRTAWFMMHRIREAMKADAIIGTMRGTITADETWIGGDPSNRHANHWRNQPRRITPGMNARTDKTAVLALINAETGEVRSRVVPDVTGATLRKAIGQHVDMSNSTLHTDSHSGYILLGREFAAHHAVDHKNAQYVLSNGASTNMAENFFSQLKRSIDGTHHHVSVEHLPRYLAEFDYRYTTRHHNDTARMDLLVGQMGGRRLTYKRVVAH